MKRYLNSILLHYNLLLMLGKSIQLGHASIRPLESLFGLSRRVLRNDTGFYSFHRSLAHGNLNNKILWHYRISYIKKRFLFPAGVVLFPYLMNPVLDEDIINHSLNLIPYCLKRRKLVGFILHSKYIHLGFEMAPIGRKGKHFEAETSSREAICE